MTLYEKISEALTDRRITVVAERTGLHIKTIGDIRRGTAKPRDTTLLILSAYLKIDDNDD